MLVGNAGVSAGRRLSFQGAAVARAVRVGAVSIAFGVATAAVVSYAPVPNPTVRLRSRRLDDLVLALSVGRGPIARGVKSGVRALTPQQFRRGALDVTWRRVLYGTSRPPDETLMAELRRRFKPQVVALSEYLGRDLVALWGYDDVV
jgi:hypothetical protein